MSSQMLSFRTNDNVTIRYLDTGKGDPNRWDKDPLILIHGFTGSSAVWQRNIPVLAKKYRVIAPDLRGHGSSGKPKHGYHVTRLAMDLRELILHLTIDDARGDHNEMQFKALGGSLGCSILWAYSELFTTVPFTHMMFVDQSPLQNFSLDGWDARFCNRGMNGAPAVAAFQTALKLAPEAVLKDVIASCLSYRSHPLPTDNISPETFAADEAFFLTEALKGDPEWYGKLMSDHTSLDWRDSIRGTFGERNGSPTKVFVVASSRSGPFPSAGPLAVVDLVNNDEDGQLDAKLAKGVVIDWGGHWCYWEDPEKFNKLALDFFAE